MRSTTLLASGVVLQSLTTQTSCSSFSRLHFDQFTASLATLRYPGDNNGIHLAVAPACGSLSGNTSDVNAGIDLNRVKTIVAFGVRTQVPVTPTSDQSSGPAGLVHGWRPRRRGTAGAAGGSASRRRGRRAVYRWEGLDRERCRRHRGDADGLRGTCILISYSLHQSNGRCVHAAIWRMHRSATLAEHLQEGRLHWSKCVHATAAWYRACTYRWLQWQPSWANPTSLIRRRRSTRSSSESSESLQARVREPCRTSADAAAATSETPRVGPLSRLLTSTDTLSLTSRRRSEPPSRRASHPLPDPHPRERTHQRARLPPRRRLRARHAHARGRRVRPDRLLWAVRLPPGYQLHWKGRRRGRGPEARRRVRAVQPDLGRGARRGPGVCGVWVREHRRVHRGLLDRVLLDGGDVRRPRPLFLLHSEVSRLCRGPSWPAGY